MPAPRGQIRIKSTPARVCPKSGLYPPGYLLWAPKKKLGLGLRGILLVVTYLISRQPRKSDVPNVLHIDVGADTLRNSGELEVYISSVGMMGFGPFHTEPAPQQVRLVQVGAAWLYAQLRQNLRLPTSTLRSTPL